MRLAWTDPSAPVHHAPTGWDTSQALLALKVLFNNTQKVERNKEVGHLKVGQVKNPPSGLKRDLLPYLQPNL